MKTYLVKVTEVNSVSNYIYELFEVNNLANAADIFTTNILNYDEHLRSHRYTSNIALYESFYLTQKEFNNFLQDTFLQEGILYIKIKHSNPDCYTLITLELT